MSDPKAFVARWKPAVLELLASRERRWLANAESAAANARRGETDQNWNALYEEYRGRAARCAEERDEILADFPDP